jgi:predicted metal-dependent HD superfamily phosphohydrolase
MWKTNWQTLWQELGVAQADDRLLHQLIACYSESHRYYHTLQHLTECFTHWAMLRSQAQHPAEVELALWFHDAIYQPQRHDNEQASADWAKTALLEQGLPVEPAERVYQLVLATQHHDPGTIPDAPLLLDCDLAILGAEPARFAEYEQQIRQEYAWVTLPTYQQTRRNLLQALICRPALYHTDLFRQRYEAQARTNLGRSPSLL